MKDKIKIALAQISSKREDKEANFQKIEKLTIKAKEQGADLAIFPEMSLTGYVVHDQLYELAETVPGPTVEKAKAFAKKAGTHIIFGMPELSEKTQATVFNTAVFVGPQGGSANTARCTFQPTAFLKKKDISAQVTKQQPSKPTSATSGYASVMTFSSQKSSD